MNNENQDSRKFKTGETVRFRGSNIKLKITGCDLFNGKWWYTLDGWPNKVSEENLRELRK